MSECACTKQLKLNSRCSSQQASPVATTGRRRLACPRSIRLGPMERAVKNPSGLSPTRPQTPSPQPSSRRRRGVSVTASAPNPARTQPPPIGRRAPRVPGEPEPSRTWPPRRAAAAASSLYPPPGLPSPPHAATERNLAQRLSNPTPLRLSPSNFPGAAMGRSKHPTTPFPSSSSISSSDLPFFHHGQSPNFITKSNEITEFQGSE